MAAKTPLGGQDAAWAFTMNSVARETFHIYIPSS
jgi:hypothetical protein